MKQRKKTRRAFPFFFTIETLRLAEEAVTLFEQPLDRADRRNPKVALVEQAIRQIKEKLALMKANASQGFIPLTAFDYNERIILVLALRAYSTVMVTYPATVQLSRAIQQCQQIAAYFEVKHANGEPKRREGAED